MSDELIAFIYDVAREALDTSAAVEVFERWCAMERVVRAARRLVPMGDGTTDDAPAIQVWVNATGLAVQKVLEDLRDALTALAAAEDGVGKG